MNAKAFVKRNLLIIGMTETAPGIVVAFLNNGKMPDPTNEIPGLMIMTVSSGVNIFV